MFAGQGDEAHRQELSCFQGSIIVFVLLILIYAILMNRLDRIHHEERDALKLDADNEDQSFSGEGI